MSSVVSTKDRNDAPASKCLARSVADAFSDDPTLEAVTINRARQTISVATLGKTNEEGISQRLTTGIQTSKTDPACALLSGKGDCQTCDSPLSPAEQKKITIQHEGDKTTIARVTCPTAPRFWRWRDIPFPRVVQRDVEFFEPHEHIDEWKPQLVAALLCGLFGVAGYFLKGNP